MDCRSRRRRARAPSRLLVDEGVQDDAWRGGYLRNRPVKLDPDSDERIDMLDGGDALELRRHGSADRDQRFAVASETRWRWK